MVCGIGLKLLSGDNEEAVAAMQVFVIPVQGQLNKARLNKNSQHSSYRV